MNEREFTLEEVATMVSGVLLVEKGLALVDIACFMLVITQRKSHLSPFVEPPVSCFRATDIRS